MHLSVVVLGARLAADLIMAPLAEPGQLVGARPISQPAALQVTYALQVHRVAPATFRASVREISLVTILLIPQTASAAMEITATRRRARVQAERPVLVVTGPRVEPDRRVALPVQPQEETGLQEEPGLAAEPPALADPRG